MLFYYLVSSMCKNFGREESCRELVPTDFGMNEKYIVCKLDLQIIGGDVFYESYFLHCFKLLHRKS